MRLWKPRESGNSSPPVAEDHIVLPT
jgi:hypothetical protein